MKIYKSPLPELQLKYKTTDQKKVKITSSLDAYNLLKQLYDTDTLEYLESSVILGSVSNGALKFSHVLGVEKQKNKKVGS